MYKRQVQDDSADADIALLSMDAAATTDTAPHIEEYTCLLYTS